MDVAEGRYIGCPVECLLRSALLITRDIQTYSFQSLLGLLDLLASMICKRPTNIIMLISSKSYRGVDSIELIRLTRCGPIGVLPTYM